jgi:hypothetical protein
MGAIAADGSDLSYSQLVSGKSVKDQIGRGVFTVDAKTALAGRKLREGASLRPLELKQQRFPTAASKF